MATAAAESRHAVCSGSRHQCDCETAGMRFADLAATTEAVRATGGRREKVERLGEALRALDPAEVAAGSRFLAGEPGGRVLGVGWAALRERPAPAAAPGPSGGRGDAALGRVAA